MFSKIFEQLKHLDFSLYRPIEQNVFCTFYFDIFASYFENADLYFSQTGAYWCSLYF